MSAIPLGPPAALTLVFFLRRDRRRPRRASPQREPRPHWRCRLGYGARARTNNWDMSTSIFRGGPDIAVPGRDAEHVEPPTVLKSGWLRLICRPLDQSPRRW